MSDTKEKSGATTLLMVRASYLKLAKPEAVKGEPDGKKRYGMVCLIPKDTAEGKAAYAKSLAEIERIKKANPTVKFKAKDICLQDGDKAEDVPEEYKGHWFFSANRNEDQKRPQVLGKKKSAGVIDSDHDQFPYSGCWVNVVVSFYKPKRFDKVCASLEIVQFAKNDTPFAGTQASADDLPDDEDDDDDNLDGEEEEFPGLD